MYNVLQVPWSSSTHLGKLIITFLTFLSIMFSRANLLRRRTRPSSDLRLGNLNRRKTYGVEIQAAGNQHLPKRYIISLVTLVNVSVWKNCPGMQSYLLRSPFECESFKMRYKYVICTPLSTHPLLKHQTPSHCPCMRRSEFSTQVVVAGMRCQSRVLIRIVKMRAMALSPF